ncbi:MAG: acetate kinase [Synergistales bacterium]|nr:acetate kinase [Synergistales bacterium]
MKVLVLNCGSSSLKYQLFDMTTEDVLCKGLVERIGIDGSRIKHEKNGSEKKFVDVDIPNHKKGVSEVLALLQSPEDGVLQSLDELKAVGHRVVHGGEHFSQSVIVDDKVFAAIEECIPLAPLHNPANLTGIRAMHEVLPETPQVAVFDTAFHQTMPKHSYMYGLPYEYYKKYAIRRYGFHGTSHSFVARRAAEMLGKDEKDLRIVTCHLGNGSSITAVKGGRSYDTSLGFGTVPGILMGTRCGDIDPVAVLHLMEEEELSIKEVSHILHKESGLKGVSGIGSDLRDIEEAAEKGDERASLAQEMLCYSVRKYIGAYAAAMGGLDAVVFTAGIGENSDVLRRKVGEQLGFLGAHFDPAKNNIRGEEAVISTEDSSVALMVIPTNEEYVIASDTWALVKG